MIKFFKYELKRNLNLILASTVILTILFLIPLITTRKINETIAITQIFGLCSLIFGLIGLVVIKTYSFKTEKKCVDVFYSFPLKKEKLYFIKAIVGLIIILIPFTVTYWLNFFYFLTKRFDINYIYFIPMYFSFLVLIIMIYGFQSFTFTRGNTILDGIILTSGYYLLPFLFTSMLDCFIPSGGSILENAILCGAFDMGMSGFNEGFSKLISRTAGGFDGRFFIYPCIIGVISWGLLFFTLRYEKGEKAEQISDSYWAYRTLIPICLILALSITFESLWIITPIILMGIVAYMIYKRKVKIGKRELIVLVISILIGIILMEIQQHLI